MANDKKLVEAITSMDVDFAQWYTDVVIKAELLGYKVSYHSSAFATQGFKHDTNKWKNPDYTEHNKKNINKCIRNLIQCINTHALLLKQIIILFHYA